MGFIVGVYLSYFLIQFPVTSHVLDTHIVYESPHFHLIHVMVLYLIATCASSLVSSSKTIRLFGALSLIAFLAAYGIHVAYSGQAGPAFRRMPGHRSDACRAGE